MPDAGRTHDLKEFRGAVAATATRKILMSVRGITRGELARRTGVNIETIRYFERVGMIPVPDRTEGGHRIYDERHVRMLSFVRHARELGFAPGEVRAILDLGGPGEAPCGEVKEIAAQHLEQIRSMIADLRKIENVLAAAIAECRGGKEPECSVIDMIEDGAPTAASSS